MMMKEARAPELKDREIFWRDRYEFFKTRNYILRPRYRPDWQPSLITDPRLHFEDTIISWKAALLDAHDRRHEKDVFIKRVDSRTHPNEVKIASRLGSQESQTHNKNHCVPVIEVLEDLNYQYIVMPVFRSFDDPNFTSHGEVVEFVKQTLEGLAYMHAQNVAHRDCAAENILMDATGLFKDGWHPMHPWMSRDGTKPVFPSRNRSEVKIKYYFIDFGLSTEFPPGQSKRLVSGELGRIQAPEQLTGHPYDPFKYDIYVLGTVYQTKIVDVFKGLDRLRELAERMTKPDPSERPTAEAAQVFWEALSKLPNSPGSGTRLRHTEPDAFERAVNRAEEGLELVVNTALDVVGRVRGTIGL